MNADVQVRLDEENLNRLVKFVKAVSSKEEQAAPGKRGYVASGKYSKKQRTEPADAK